MSDYQARIALARDAYRATQPTPGEVEATAARIEAQLASPAHHLRRLLHFLGGGALLGAGVLGALGGGPSSDSGYRPGAAPAVAADSAAPELASTHGSGSEKALGSLGLPRGWVQPIQIEPDAAVDPVSEAPRTNPRGIVPARTLPKHAAARPLPAQAPGEAGGGAIPPDWSQVSAALAAGDSARAGQVLDGLAASGDADTRAKALLGQAQLALSRGDRSEAKRLTTAAASVPGASAAVKEKALRWAARASL